MEIEALMAIYMDDFKMLGDDRFEIVLAPTDDENKVSVSLDVKLPPGYPQEVPILSLRVNKGISTHKLYDLEKSLRDQAKDNLGMAMIFTLVQSVKEWLDEHAGKQEEVVVVEVDEKEKRKKEQEQHERRILDGTPITVESFRAWKTKFDAEMSELKKAVVDTEKMKRPSGRQLFEFDISLVMSDTTLPEEGDTVDATAIVRTMHQNQENVVVNWELFDEIPDDDE